MHLRIAQALRGKSDFKGAREWLTNGIPILQRVLRAYPDNPNYLYHMSLFDLYSGDLFFDDGDAKGALASWRLSSEVLDRLVARDPANAEWRHSLDAALRRIDQVLRARPGLITSG